MSLDGVAQLKLSRTRRRATILFRDGTAEEFLPHNARAREDRVFVEATVPGALLRLVADALKDQHAPRGPTGQQHDADDGP